MNFMGIYLYAYKHNYKHGCIHAYIYIGLNACMYTCIDMYKHV